MKLISPTLLVSLSLLGGLAHAADPAPLGAEGCRIAPLLPAPANGAVSWSGGCKDGFAEGPGVLE